MPGFRLTMVTCMRTSGWSMKKLVLATTKQTGLSNRQRVETHPSIEFQTNSLRSITTHTLSISERRPTSEMTSIAVGGAVTTCEAVKGQAPQTQIQTMGSSVRAGTRGLGIKSGLTAYKMASTNSLPGKGSRTGHTDTDPATRRERPKVVRGRQQRRRVGASLHALQPAK
ncbi:hypothetical protein EI94DRAFT_1701501 [Lactarius quietus]|nr:hypothetical protein EI94DRAFT_1701501 [Lactarius quietus]